MTRSTTGAVWLLAALCGSAAAHGDTVFGLYAGAGAWKQEYSGDVASSDEDFAVDVESDLALDDERNNVFYLAIEHPVPVLPNLRASYTDISTTGRNVLNRTITFQDETFAVDEEVSSDVELTQAELIAYYELLDNVVSLDLGVAARWVDGHVEVVSASGAGSGRADFDGVLPLLYGRARVDLPLTGFWVGADATGLGYDGHQLLDLSAQVGWESPIGLGAELGWRRFDLELDEIEDIDGADVEIEGPYAAVNFHF